MCKQYFFRVTSINYSGIIVQGRNALSLVPGGFHVGCCAGLVVQGRIIQEKMSWGEKVGVNCPGRSFMGDNCPGGNYSGVIARKAKVRRGGAGVILHREIS